jgi:hypothetical protein
MTPPPHTMQLAGRALTIAIHDALRRDLERNGGRTEAPRDLGDAGRDLRRLRRLASDPPAVQHGRPRSSPCASSADAGCEDPAR